MELRNTRPCCIAVSCGGCGKLRLALLSDAMAQDRHRAAQK